MSKKGKFLKSYRECLHRRKRTCAAVWDNRIQARLQPVCLDRNAVFEQENLPAGLQNVWRYIKDELATLDSICNEIGLQPSDMEQFISDGGTMQYSYVRIKQIDGKYSKRQFYYMIHVLKKNEQVALDPNYLLLADSPQLLND